MNKTDANFWVSYSDLMTSLFLIMVTLFAVSSILLYVQYFNTKTKLEDLEAIEASIKSVKGKYFGYDSILKRHQLKVKVQFKVGSDSLLQKYEGQLDSAGRLLQDTVESIFYRYKNRMKVRFTILIEGSTDSIKFIDDGSIDPKKWYDNSTLSYRRALVLKNFWISKGIIFDPNFCDVQVAGSGDFGVDRERVDSLNRRFLIQILPKIGDLKD
jgi:outer membrane protein OmpA-like peptidoglycan-associated protein